MVSEHKLKKPPKTEKFDKERAEWTLEYATLSKEKLERKLRGLRYETNLEFTPVIIPKREFSKIKKENKQFWKDLVTYGIIFKGYELFYYYAYLK